MFSSDLGKPTETQLARGQRLVEILKQPQYRPIDVEKQVAVIWAATNGYVDAVPVEQVREWEQQFVQFLDNSRGSLLEGIRAKKALDDDLKGQLKAATEEFNSRFGSKSAGATA